MKKILLVLLLGLLWGGNVYAWRCDQGSCISGPGVETSANGEKYDGEFKDGKFHGQGTYTYSNGAKYVGEWKDDKREGQGTYTWPDGGKYFTEKGSAHVGEWKNGQRHGKGTFTSANGEIKEGIWENGKFFRDKSAIVRYKKCILKDLKGQSDKEVIKIIKDACTNKASNPSAFDKLFN